MAVAVESCTKFIRKRTTHKKFGSSYSSAQFNKAGMQNASLDESGLEFSFLME